MGIVFDSHNKDTGRIPYEFWEGLAYRWWQEICLPGIVTYKVTEWRYLYFSENGK